MPFTAAELDNIINASIDFHSDKRKVHAQSLQDKPLLALINENKRAFPGGKDYITLRAKGTYTTSLQGLSGDDSASYANPTNLKTASYPWMFLHSGISFTKHELAKNGITMTDDSAFAGGSNKSDAEQVQLANLIQDKLDDMEEGTERSENVMYWRDGTQDALEVPGITSFILDNPTSATVVAGIDQSANSWWRNRAHVGFNQGSTPSDLLVTNLLQKEIRQLRRYGGRPTKGLAGSDFLEWMEKELRSKGTFTQDGWAKTGKIDMGTADIAFKGIMFEYDPTLDDLSKSKYLYLLDPKTIYKAPLSGEEWQKHSPARPEDKYVFYRAKTYMGGLVCTQRNANGVYSIT